MSIKLVNDYIWYCKDSVIGCDIIPVGWVYWSFMGGLVIGVLMMYLIFKYGIEKEGGGE